MPYLQNSGLLRHNLAVASETKLETQNNRRLKVSDFWQFKCKTRQALTLANRAPPMNIVCEASAVMSFIRAHGVRSHGAAVGASEVSENSDTKLCLHSSSVETRRILESLSATACVRRSTLTRRSSSSNEARNRSADRLRRLTYERASDVSAMRRRTELRQAAESARQGCYTL